uniref:Uncharacterized protein n=1 Tax=Arundo donax TaxID=35708 RepID=A0A0A9DD15_ARUDO
MSSSIFGPLFYAHDCHSVIYCSPHKWIICRLLEQGDQPVINSEWPNPAGCRAFT